MTFLGEPSEAERNHMSLNAMFKTTFVVLWHFLSQTRRHCQSVTKKQDIRESPKDNSYSPYSFVAFQHESTDR